VAAEPRRISVRSGRRPDKDGIPGKQLVARLQADPPGCVDDHEGDGANFDGIAVFKQDIGPGRAFAAMSLENSQFSSIFPFSLTISFMAFGSVDISCTGLFSL